MDRSGNGPAVGVAAVAPTAGAAAAGPAVAGVVAATTPVRLAGAAGGRESWPALPRRRRRPARAPRLLAIGAPIPAGIRWALRLLSLATPLAIWYALSASHAVDATFLPSPSAVWSAGVDMLRSGVLLHDTAASVRRILLGFGLGVAISVPLGFAMGTFRAAQAVFEPLVGLLRYLPASAFIPLLIIWLGLGEPPKVTLLVIGVVFFNTLMTADAVRLVPRELLDVSYTLGATRTEVIRKVVLPHSLPGIIDAMRVNVAAAWNFVVVAELIAATSGLGYRITRAQRFLQTDRIFAVLVVIGLIGLTLDVLLRLLREWVGRWAA
ncbi:MAG: NitT/TauT family transport system permease protein [Mycobacteriales bacterium]